MTAPYEADIMELFEDGMVHRFREVADIMEKYSRHPAQATPVMNLYIKQGRAQQYGRGLYGKPGLPPTAKIFESQQFGTVRCGCCKGKGFISAEHAATLEKAMFQMVFG